MRVPDLPDLVAAVGVGFHAVKGEPSPEETTVETVAAEQAARARTIFESVATTSVVAMEEPTNLPSIIRVGDVFHVTGTERS
ncbi:MAG: hypothetical protein ABL963_12255 [Longimicrobiales bacterium]